MAAAASVREGATDRTEPQAAQEPAPEPELLAPRQECEDVARSDPYETEGGGYYEDLLTIMGLALNEEELETSEPLAPCQEEGEEETEGIEDVEMPTHLEENEDRDEQKPEQKHHDNKKKDKHRSRTPKKSSRKRRRRSDSYSSVSRRRRRSDSRSKRRRRSRHRRRRR